MKKIIAPLLLGAALSSAFAADDSLKQEIEALKAQMAELKSAQSKLNVDALRAQVSEIKAHDAGDNVKFNVDFRTSYDVVDYKMQTPTGAKTSTDNGIWTNKLILGMGAQPADNLVFKGALGAYTTFGNNSSSEQNGFQGMDWYGTQSPGDSTIKLREAYFLYTGDMGDVHYSASFGRRPSVDGFLTNLRAGNADPASPIGHNINMEFDGASFKFDIDKITGISGMYLKLCLGRGNSSADARFPEFTGYNGTNFGMANATAAHTPYSTNGVDAPNMDLAGLIFQIYDDGQYKVMSNYFKGWNMMGANFTRLSNNGTPANPMDDTYNVGLTDVGDLTGGALSFQVNGIGNGISDFLDDTIFFASYAFSKTDPKGVHNILNPYSSTGTTATTEMLGSADKETGYSIYTGIQVPGIMKDQRLGLEYNHGSKYWRSFTYGEDTLIGSKLAARGDAYEVYYTLPLVGKNLTAQLSYIYIDYDYTGSDMFFGSTGTPMDKAQAAKNGATFIESASNIRASLRYRY
ncbi:DUF3373 family protein [Sulfurospirillum sp.]|uniref:DUF3373 family protein n=1 Tax=Sulfurospirillum sp. TaxID=2053622 RepID=UPI002FDC8BBE